MNDEQTILDLRSLLARRDGEIEKQTTLRRLAEESAKAKRATIVELRSRIEKLTDRLDCERDRVGDLLDINAELRADIARAK